MKITKSHLAVLIALLFASHLNVFGAEEKAEAKGRSLEVPEYESDDPSDENEGTWGLNDVGVQETLVSLASTNVTVNEGAGSFDVVVTRTGDGVGKVGVNFRCLPGTASVGGTGGTGDYVDAMGYRYWEDGELGDQVFNIRITDDSIAEGSESFTVEIFSYQDTPIGNSQTILTIIDNDTEGGGDGVISVTGDTDFGTVNVDSGSEMHTLTISNTGTGVLTLTANPAVALSGAESADFSVTQPASTIDAGSSTTFTVTFDPSAEGVRNAVLTIQSDDETTPTLTVAITGEGVVGVTPADPPSSGEDLSAGGGDDDGCNVGFAGSQGIVILISMLLCLVRRTSA